MSYFTKVFRSTPKAEQKDSNADVASFTHSWEHIRDTLQRPDERQLTRGIGFTDIPNELRQLVNQLVLESTPDADTTGPCLEYTLKHDVLNTLVRLSSNDLPFGIKTEVVRAMLNLVVLMDEHFLVHSTVHKAVLRLLRSCVRDESRSFDGGTKARGAAGASRGRPSDYEEDLVDLMCALCSRIRLYPQLLLIFFHDKNVYHDLEEDEIVQADVNDEDDAAELSFASITSTALEIAQRSISPTPSATTITSAPTASSFYRRPEYEFLAYNYLLRFIHREGKIGDNARTGLLFLMDVAMSASELSPHKPGASPPTSDPLSEASLTFAEYILESDFPDVLAAALGAVYSLLPSKLIVRKEGSRGKEPNGTMVLGGMKSNEDESDIDEELERARAFGMDVSTSPEFKARLVHFIKMIDFIQEVVIRETTPSDNLDNSASTTIGRSIAKSILKFLRSSFLENVLYPSILECSDEDGSAVAVITYLEAILSTVKDDQMSEVIINFLTSDDGEEPAKEPSHLKKQKNRSRKSKQKSRQSTALTLLQLETGNRRKSTYYNSLGRFTVKDLLLSNLESKSQPTASAALKLLNTLLTQHGLLALPRIFTLLPETNLYLNGHALDEDELKTPRPGFLSPEDDFFSTAYSPRANASKSEDDLMALRHVPLEIDDADSWRHLVARIDPKFAAEAQRGGNTQYLQDAQDWLETQLLWSNPLLDSEADTEQILSLPDRKYRLSPTDPLLAQLLNVTQRFFSHSPDMNLSLTGVIHAIACSPQLSLADWITHSVTSHGSTQPAMYTCLSSLTAQLPKYRHQAPKFDQYLEQRRRGLLSSAQQDSDTLDTPVKHPTSSSQSAPVSEHSGPVTPAKKPHRYAGFVAYFSPSRARAASAEAEHTPPHSRHDSRESPPSPLERHYRETRAVHLTPLKGALPSAGPWSPAQRKRQQVTSPDERDEPEGGAAAWGGEDEPVSRPKTPEQREEKEVETTTLSELLDNVVVLEEGLKEISAVVQMRRVIGIDD
ncbi:hypothetical protein DACRYDRAFT_59996 [Dacryopinax primogenitus]|uniref:FHF complex subunit HOOK-interacting protein C-terminal domain-containing protein n=1 Tax=Dacryopinax primogenitus (strain DJM 731) TaxID=1858805 RepID=M5FZB5_DACPD|nr:uncharacterized protein DACRYDRAFT_59996 [Dacryopinax primogenitus]EJT96847.1 hypothetical protein DACRYDRAFT_59996 [Dacryopinax primogenitus]